MDDVNFENGIWTCTKTFKFEGAHVLHSSYSEECQNIHGHSYIVDVNICAEELNEDGMVIDFKELKDAIGYIFEDLDHAMLFHSDTYIDLIEKCPGILDFGWKMRVLGEGINPTAENMAKFFYDAIDEELECEPFRVLSVKVRETKTGAAKYFKA